MDAAILSIIVNLAKACIKVCSHALILIWEQSMVWTGT